MTWGLKELGPVVLSFFSVGLAGAGSADCGALEAGVDGVRVSTGTSLFSVLQDAATAAMIAATPADAMALRTASPGM